MNASNGRRPSSPVGRRAAKGHSRNLGFRSLIALLAFALTASIGSVALGQPSDKDLDRDGFSPNQGDCNDQDASINPDAVEVCDGVDNDCDNTTDEDEDGDGFGVCDDCDDDDVDRSPGNSEACDAAGKDNDCDAATLDTDLSISCYEGPAGTRNRGICRGGDRFCDGAGSYSGACVGQITPEPTETCDGRDDDCDGRTDEDFDQDNDGFADEDANCTGPGPFDCNDDDDEINPDAEEKCNGVDDACDGDNDNLLEKFCYDGPNGTLNKGICTGGTRRCSGTTYDGQPCEGDVVPVDNLPGGEEAQCDGLDDDCDGEIDEDYDADGDGFVDESEPLCNGVGTPVPKDCDDDDASIYPGAPEQCDGIDSACDGDNDSTLTRTCYTGDRSTRGVGLCSPGTQTCSGVTWDGQPCEGEVLPEDEVCDGEDNDCDGLADDPWDLDEDGFVTDDEPTCLTGVDGPYDCLDDPRVNPAAPDSYPGAQELCDGVDNACDGDNDAMLTRPCYTGPEDTFNVGICVAGVQTCSGTTWDGQPCEGEITPQDGEAAECNNEDDDCDGTVDEGFDQDDDGFTSCGGDCDDDNEAINPSESEVCNNIDDDCDGTVDGFETDCYTGPPDTEGVGQCSSGKTLCIDGVPQDEDCSDVTPKDERVVGCNGADDDCDGTVDEDFDRDGDGVSTCARPVPDCDDDSIYRRPGIPERCDCTDNDCDGEIDEIDTDSGPVNICEFGACHDFDGDGFTNCEGDCDDQNLTVNPSLPELCPDGLDNDCDGLIDEDVDEDGDLVTTCGGDCDDRFSTIRPGITEFCDGFDNDCDGRIDEGFDNDGDGFTICQGDCDDEDDERDPFNEEICGDGIDNDCDGLVDPDFDADGDGFSVCDGDCNDFNASVYPGAEEKCDGILNDCDCDRDPPGSCIDLGFDQDGDFFATCFGDCDDTDPDINPSARDVDNDGVDDNCNGLVDEGTGDSDADGFDFECDCDDSNPNVSPQTDDICDGFDNDCDGLVDRTPWGELTCDVCNDVDEDGVEDCDGDCDDTNPQVYPGAPEQCDGLDNDCNGTVDLDRVTRESVCIGDVGPRADGSVTTDGGDADGAAGDAGVPGDGSNAEDTGSATDEPTVEVGCGCTASSTPKSPSTEVVLWLVIGLAAVAGRWVRRARPARAGVLAAGLAGGLLACSGLDLPDLDAGDRRADDDASQAPDGADGAADIAPDGGPVDARDAGFVDSGPDAGPLNNGPCRLANRDPVRLTQLPGTELRLAVDASLETASLGGIDAMALDDPERQLRGFAVSFELSDAFDPADPGVANLVIDSFLDPALDDGVPGVVGVAARVDESLRQRFSASSRPAARTIRRIEMVNDVLVSRVRDGLLADVSRTNLGGITSLPDPGEESLTRSIVLQAMAVVDERVGRAALVVFLVPDGRFEASSATMGDMTNGTHVGEDDEVIGLECEDFVAEDLKVDFIWVVDNSDSMQEEQQALVDAAETFFGALEESRIDFRIGVITTDGEALRGGSFTSNIDAFRTRVQVGISGDGTEAGLEYARIAIENARTTVNENQRLRDDAIPVLIFFSDEDSTNPRPLDEYVTAFGDAGVLPFAIVGPRPRGCLAVGRGFARLGESYIQVVEELEGTTASICSDSLDEPVREILVAAAGAASQIQLDDIPISASLEVQLATSTVARSRLDGFDYEPTANSILFFGEASLPVGTPFRVSYLRFRRIQN